MSKANAKYSFVDLFAGIGGFHAALAATGGVCEYAVEIDREAAAVYERNWNKPALGDITDDANDEGVTLRGYDGPIDVLTGGFPCQPFSKSGAQHGMAETRGTLFWNIARIIEEREPTVLILENVRNLVGPRHRHEWLTIIETLRFFGYEVSGAPAIFSPHLLPAWMGGTPQVRERVFITATLVPERMRDERIPRTETGEIDAEAIGPKPVATMNDRFPLTQGGPERFHPGDRKSGWNLLTSGIIREGDPEPSNVDLRLTETETLWIDAWDDLESTIRRATGRPLEGFPYWADSWTDFRELSRLVVIRGFQAPEREVVGDRKRYVARTDMPEGFVPASVTRPAIDETLPAWKQSHLRRNYDFFERHFAEVVAWAYRWGVYTDLFPASRRKLEWQAQDAPRLWDTVMHFRPSGIRAKRPTYLPALVAITQTSIVGPLERRLSPRETARLQGLPEWFDFGEQRAAATYKQMGNGVNVGVVRHILREHVRRDRALLKLTPAGQRIINAVLADEPDATVGALGAAE